MMDIPSGSIKVTKNSDGTGTIVISTGQLIYASGAPAGVLGGTETLVYAFKLTTSQCTTVATRLAQSGDRRRRSSRE